MNNNGNPNNDNMLYGILGILGLGFVAHFMLGHSTKAIFMLITWFVGIGGIWSIIDGVFILTNKNTGAPQSFLGNEPFAGLNGFNGQ